MGDDMAKIVLALLALAAFVNIARGSFWQWLHAKFIGAPATTPSPYKSTSSAANAFSSSSPAPVPSKA